MTPKAHPAPRVDLSIDQLRQYAGKWVAFSSDGTRIVASDDDLLRLDELIRSAGEDPESVGLERIELEDFSLGGAELL